MCADIFSRTYLNSEKILCDFLLAYIILKKKLIFYLLLSKFTYDPWKSKWKTHKKGISKAALERRDELISGTTDKKEQYKNSCYEVMVHKLCNEKCFFVAKIMPQE